MLPVDARLRAEKLSGLLAKLLSAARQHIEYERDMPTSYHNTLGALADVVAEVDAALIV